MMMLCYVSSHIAVKYSVWLYDGNPTFGVAQNFTEAAKYLNAFSRWGNPVAQYYFALCLWDGNGVSRNRGKAIRYFKLSEDQGYPEAKRAWERLPEMLIRAESEEFQRANRDFKRAADDGLASAQGHYGHVLLTGTIVERNAKEAARYFKLSADQGYRDAQYAYARLMQVCLVNWNARQMHLCLKRAADHGTHAEASKRATMLPPDGRGGDNLMKVGLNGQTFHHLNVDSILSRFFDIRSINTTLR
jgi:TPR repeat protein